MAIIATAAGMLPQSGDQPGQQRVMHEATSALTQTEDSLSVRDMRFGPDEDWCGDPAYA